MEILFRPLKSRGIRVLPVLAVLACVQAGRDSVQPSWQALDDAGTIHGQPIERYETRHGRRIVLSDEPGRGEWLRVRLLRDDWTFDPDLHGGVWKAVAPLRGRGRPTDGPEQRLVTRAGKPFRFRPPELLRQRWNLEPGDFAIVRGVVHLKLDPNQSPPRRAHASVYAGDRQPGRVSGTRFSGRGLALWPGQRAERSVEIPTGHDLRFATAVEPALAPIDPSNEPVVFRVLLDGQRIFEHTGSDLEHAKAEWHRIELPRRAGAKLSFQVTGGLAYASFAAPMIVPRESGSYAVRPWAGARPNIVVFLADTFRADNLSAYGEASGLTPYLNELARGSRLFRRAWSVGTFTLPAHASMFSGVYPHQVGIVGTGRALPESLVTIAERLAQDGYRTGAITDSVIVSQKYGFDQGFEWFDERRDSIAGTAGRVRQFLDADDGRPVFLFVQSYRTHLPYRVSEHVRWSHGEALGIEDLEFWDLENVRTRLAQGENDPELAAIVSDGLRNLYRGAVMDLDHGFQSIHQAMEGRGLLDDGYLIFTSDHGEALAEHGAFYHTGPPFEEQSRIPMFIIGPDIEPETVEHAASLVDLAPTLADLAGVTAEPAWLGRSLKTLDFDRPTFVFECRGGENAKVAVIDGNQKILGLEDGDALRRGQVVAAFDLSLDPTESENLAETEVPAWSSQLMQRVGPDVAELLDPIVGPRAASLTADARKQLRELGYIPN
jgi:hypothetical protein